MEKTQHKLLTISVPAGADLASAKRFVKMSSGALVYCGANGKSIGVLELPVASGDMAPVIVHGVVLVEVGSGGVSEGAQITSDATGKAIAAANVAVASAIATGAVAMKGDAENATVTSTVTGGNLPIKINGIALDAGSEGDFVRVILK